MKFVFLLTYVFMSLFYFVFFFKQKTAYEMRISDWSSDVCSSDLDYRVKLAHAKVMLDPAERRKLIAEQAAGLAKNAGVTVKDDAGLLDEVAGLVEWPQVLMGRIDAAFMDLPGEVLSTTMRSHQKYFSTEKPAGTLADRFMVVANMEAPEGSEVGRAGGRERVGQYV